MLAQLADIRFEGLRVPTTWEEAHEGTYAEIPIINGKPVLQKTGEQLVKIEIELRLRSEFTDPSADLEQLKTYQVNGDVLPFMSGSGNLIGRFVIRHFEITARQLNGDGSIREANVTLSLLEYGNPNTQTGRGGTALESARANAQTPISAVQTDASAINSGISQSRSAVNLMQSGVNDFRRGTKSFNRTVREIRTGAMNVQNVLEDVQTRVQTTRKIAQRATQLPTSLDEAIRYAENLARIDSVADISSLEAGVSSVDRSTRRVQSNASSIAAFGASKETGN